MNELNDEQLDKIIKSKFETDNYISDKANSAFANFDPNNFNKQFKNTHINKNENVSNVQFINQEHNQKEKVNKSNKNTGKVIEVNFYKRMNRILSVAAVSLTVVLIGGSTLYFKGVNPFNNQSKTIVIDEKQLVNNEKLEVNNEKILKEVELGYVKVYMLGKKDIGINLTSTYWDKYGASVKSTDCYKIDNITENVSDIFIGDIGGPSLRYVFLLMEDGTIQYVNLNCYSNGSFYFVANKLDGLYDVVGFEQKSRKYSYSNTDYEYVNAIKSDGLRKEIEIGMVNSWNDTETVNYNKLNEKYIKVYNKTGIPDEGGDYTVNNITYLSIIGESRYAYFMKGDSFYRAERSTAKEECLAYGVSGYIRNNADGRLTVMLSDKYQIYILDKNIIFTDKNKKQINEISNNNKVTNVVANQINYRKMVVQGKDSNGNTVWEYITPEENHPVNIVNEAQKLIETRNGKVYLCDWGKLYILDEQTGNVLAKNTSVNIGGAGAFTFDSNDNLYVISYLSDLNKFDKNGNLLNKTGELWTKGYIWPKTMGISGDKLIINFDNQGDVTVDKDTLNIYDGMSNKINSQVQGAKLIKKLGPSGWAGSSMQEVRLYDNGNVYHVTYNGEGNTEKNIICFDLIAKNADTIEEKGNNLVVDAIIVKGKNLEVIVDNESWILFQNN